MSASSAICLLVLYPLLFNLPLNFVRFQWASKQRLAPMPRDVQERAEAADRAVLLVMYLILLVVVVSFMNRSVLSMYEVGLTAANWKSAMALGVLVSYVPVSLGALLQRFLTTDKPEEQPESRGPIATWCGLTTLGALSVELWRVFSIALLIRLELSPWLAVLIVAVAYGASQLPTSTARAVGAATFGATAGFLFVKTGSLLAPWLPSYEPDSGGRRTLSNPANGIESVENFCCFRIQWRTRNQTEAGKYSSKRSMPLLQHEL